MPQSATLSSGVAGHSRPGSTARSGGSTHALAYPPGHEVFWHTHVKNLRGSVVFAGVATTTYVRGSLLSLGPQQWSTFRKPACRTGGDAGAAPAGSTIGLYARATTREPRRSGLRRLRKQQGEGLAAPSVCETRSRREYVAVRDGESASGAHGRVQQRGAAGVEPLQEASVVCCLPRTPRTADREPGVEWSCFVHVRPGWGAWVDVGMTDPL